MRKGVIRIGAGVALLTVAPVFWVMGDVANKPRPPHGDAVVGTWEHLDAKGDVYRLKFNNYNVSPQHTLLERGKGDGVAAGNSPSPPPPPPPPSPTPAQMAIIETPTANIKGRVDFGTGAPGSPVVVSPLVAFLGKTKSLTVNQWPSSSAPAPTKGAAADAAAAATLVVDGKTFTKVK
jgi:hypothetical protein